MYKNNLELISEYADIPVASLVSKIEKQLE